MSCDQSLVFPCLPMTRGHGSSATLNERGDVRRLCMVDRPERRAVRGSSGCSSLREG